MLWSIKTERRQLLKHTYLGFWKTVEIICQAAKLIKTNPSHGQGTLQKEILIVNQIRLPYHWHCPLAINSEIMANVGSNDQKYLKLATVNFSIFYRDECSKQKPPNHRQKINKAFSIQCLDITSSYPPEGNGTTE